MKEATQVASFVPVFVPEDRLAEIHAVLGRTPEMSAPQPVAPETPAATEPLDEERRLEAFWSDRANVLEHLAPRSELARRILRYLAEHAGQRLGFAEIAAGLGEPQATVGGAVGPVGVYLGRRNLDFPYRWDVEDGPVMMQMAPEVAEAILEVVPAP
jgi:hypothetical protein